jgi:3-phenylpropionate/trans-cinnamate dioxygenase ferredoxin component
LAKNRESEDLPMSGFLPAAKVTDVPDPGKIWVEVDGRMIVLFHVGGKFFALDDVCTHDGGPLSEGELDTGDCTIACPRHGAKFDIRDGRALTMPATKATVAHEVKVSGNDVLVKLNE